MVDPVRTLVRTLDAEIAALPGAQLAPGLGAGVVARFTALVGQAPPPGLGAFLAAHDGGTLGSDVRLLGFGEAASRYEVSSRTEGQKGLWPVLERGRRLFALDEEGAFDEEDAEWPVVEVTERGIERVGTSYLRFLHVLVGELAHPTWTELERAQESCRRDPGLADHWLAVLELQERAGDSAAIERTLEDSVRAATPPTPALLFALGFRILLRGEPEAAERAFEDAIALEPFSTRDDDARLDAAAFLLMTASERRDVPGMTSARRVLGEAASATAAYWRGEALDALSMDEPVPAGRENPSVRAELALRVVAALVPEDPDLARLRAGGTALRAGLMALRRARDHIEGGRLDEAIREARGAVTQLPELGVAHAFLAETLNAAREPGALEAARKATQLNPFLVEGWRELGDAELDASDFSAAEKAFRRVVELDQTYGLGFAKLAQVLLEEGRTLEALEAIAAAADRGGDPFFVAAIKGDVYAEMERHGEAAAAYDQALKIEPDDHWALHQAAIEHGLAGHETRSNELFEMALQHDEDGCFQTLIDYGDHLRRHGRIGDAVRMYRKAVAAVPSDPEWKQTLRDAEKELLAAPN